MNIDNTNVSITMSYEPVRIPPFEDILVLSKKSQHGLRGMTTCMNLLAPDGFDLFEIEDDIIEAVIISRRIQKRINKDQLLEMLRVYVFPEMSLGDLMKVDMTVRKTIQINKDNF